MNLSTQKYKIWVNTSWLVFLSAREFKADRITAPVYVLIHYPPVAKIVQLIHKLQSGMIDFPVIVVCKNKAQAWTSLLRAMKIVFAAGGLVQNSTGKYLFFYRRGAWDLPKGKLDKGEKNKPAALREVREEVGLDCKIISLLPTTYHTYFDKGKLVLKETAWYKMKAVNDKVRLQYEEDIEKYRWILKSDFGRIRKKIYPNLLAMLGKEMEIG